MVIKTGLKKAKGTIFNFIMTIFFQKFVAFKGAIRKFLNMVATHCSEVQCFRAGF
jgi:hypothetical protein